jgi:methylene-tetrahydromethanopterin dehydrogenase
MEPAFVLHLLSPLQHVSPFDVNMAAEAGYGVIVPYTHVRPEEVTGLAQDAIFSRPPDHAGHTGIFVGGRDAGLALDMLEAARTAMFPPFQVSVLADPSGSFTTAAAMIATVEKHLKPEGLKGLSVQVYGATGVVGGIVGVLAAKAGARVTLVSHRGIDAVKGKADEFKRRFGVDLGVASAPDDETKSRLLADADVALTAGKAGVQVISAANLAPAKRLKVAADINAVPPYGIEGIEPGDDGKPLPGASAVGIGALAIGGLKFQVQLKLLERMRGGGGPYYLDFQDAYMLAHDLVHGATA